MANFVDFQGFTRCDMCTTREGRFKVVYSTEEEAVNVASNFRALTEEERELEPYLREDCGFWHLRTARPS